MKKILIAIPCMDMVSARFAQSLTTLKKVGQCTVSFLIGSLIYDSRNKLAGYAVEMEADYILWLDSDMVFQPDTLERMMQTLDEHEEIDILSGIYYRRGHPFTPVAFDKLEINEKGECEFEDMAKVPEGLSEIAGCGFGCVLMRTDCLLDIASKYGAVWFTPFHNVGEDCSFCIRVREEGYKIYCDPDIELGHMAFAPVTKDLYHALNKENGKNGDNA